MVQKPIHVSLRYILVSCFDNKNTISWSQVAHIMQVVSIYIYKCVTFKGIQSACDRIIRTLCSIVSNNRVCKSRQTIVNLVCKAVKPL